MSANAQATAEAASPDPASNAARPAPEQLKARNRAVADAKLLRTLYQVHWISAAVCLILLLLFALTGVVMNHSSVFKTEPVVVNQEAQLPDALLPVLMTAAADVTAPATQAGATGRGGISRGQGREQGAKDQGSKEQGSREQGPVMQLPPQVDAWVAQQFALNTVRAEARLQADAVRVTKRSPGHQTVISIDLNNGLVKHEVTDRGWLAYLTDLHKAKSAGDAWRWFVDFFAFGVLVFALSGLWILQRHAPRRRAVWPTVALGVVLPIAVILLFVR